MKITQSARSIIGGMALGLAVLSCATVAHATPYASAITNLGSGKIQFTLNEAADSVAVVFGDGTSNVMGALPKGTTNFTLPGANTTYQIIAKKVGNGIPVQISTDTLFAVYSGGVTPRGVDVNKNPKNGPLFGRVFVADTGTGTTRQWGIYGVTPDLASNAIFGNLSTNAMTVPIGGVGPWGPAFNTGNGGFGSGPYRIRVMGDGTIWATDATDAGANLYQFGPNFEFTNQIFLPTGRLAGQNANSHGNILEVEVTGSLATHDLQVWTADNSLPVPAGTPVMGNGGVSNLGQPQSTVPGDANEIYRYDIGSGPLPWTNAPVFAYTVCLNGGFANSQVLGVGLGTDTNKVYVMVRRANASDGNIQVMRKDTGERLYTSLHGTPAASTDPFANANGTGAANGAYGGVRVSPDGKYLATLHFNNIIEVVNLVDGIPDESTLITIANTPSGATGREIAWDAADNLYAINSSGQNLLRVYSLGLTTTAITANDITGTNGTFQLVLPPVTTSVVKTSDASQNYVNNAPPGNGTPTPGVFQINMASTVGPLPSPVTIAYTMSGTATNGVNYNINTGTFAGGVVVTTTNITFPQGFAGSSSTISITPTASPLSGPTLTAILKLSPGTNFIVSSPSSATVNIINTGPQFLFLTAAASGNTMIRSIVNDYAKFVLNRWGDLNGPSNTATSINPSTLTITNFTYLGTAVAGFDYTALAQNTNANAPVDGTPGPGVTLPPGVGAVTIIVGNPLKHTNVFAQATNTTIILSLTNATTGTNLTSQEGLSYTVSTATVTDTLVDNSVGFEVVLWSDPLTNSAASYAVTFASTNLATNSTIPPVYIPNYMYTNGGAPNGSAANFPLNSNNFEVQLGWPLANELSYSGIPVPPSAVMVANGWSNVLRMTVNKSAGGQAPAISGVNLFPTTQKFNGNYALRFDMYLDVYQNAIGNPAPLTFPREFATFGINTLGTNCDWRVSSGVTITNTGYNPTNVDGLWFMIDAADGSLTPADFDGFASPALPNYAPADFVSNAGVTQQGIFKRPPFPFTDATTGAPVNTWVDVSVETRSQTNIQLYIDRAPVIASFSPTNTPSGVPGLWTNGLPMLGYCDPYSDQADESAFVYYSHVRVVELSPYILTHPTNFLVLPGTNITLSTSATYATSPMTNTWVRGTLAAPVVVQSATNAVTNSSDSLTLTNVTVGSNYWALWSDPAGSVTGMVSSVEVIKPQTNATVNQGASATFTITPSGPSQTTSPIQIGYLWKTNGVGLVNGNKYQGVTNVTLTVSNCQPADALVTYSCLVTNTSTNLTGLFYTVTAQSLTTPASTLTLVSPPTNAVVSPAAQTNVWGSSATFTVAASGSGPFSYVWKKGAVNLAGATKYSGTNTSALTISNLTTADSGSYTATLTNSAGTNNSTAGVLTVLVPPPSFTTSGSVLLSGGNVVMTFGSTNTFDTTNAFTLQSSPFVQGPYTNNSTASFTTNGSGFQVTVPQSGANMFYRLLHVP